MSEIQKIQKRVNEWLNSEQGKAYKNCSPEELIFALEQNDVLTLAELNTLKSASVFTAGNKSAVKRTEFLDGWGIEKGNTETANNKQTDINKKLIQRLDKVKTELDSKVKENRFLRTFWHGVKNTFGFGANSKKVEQALKLEREKISQIKNPEVFMELTGVEYSEENYEKLIKGEIKFKSEQALEAYKQGQDGVVDFVGDLVSGIAAFGIYTAAVAAAPFTGGASIAIGFAAATASGALIKTGLKAGAAVISGKEYTKENLKYDLLTGGVSGALGPFTGGAGGAVGKSVAARFGIQAVKEGVTSVAANTAKQGFKQGLKTALINPAGYKYTAGKQLFEKGFINGIKNLFTRDGAKIAGAYISEMVVDGAMSGTIDGGFRAGLENKGDRRAILSGALEGGIGGGIGGIFFGGGMKLTGKAGHSFGTRVKKFFGWGKGTKQVSEAFADEAADGTVKKMGDSTEPHIKDNTGTTMHKFTASDIIDAVISKRRINFAQFGKEGIPLKYSRESFIKDLDELLSSLSPTERIKIETEFGIKIEYTTFNKLGKEIEGIPIIPENFSGTQNEQAVANLIRKFTVENEVQIADNETKEVLESILHTFPEFAMTVGKKQHDTHRFSVDIHTLRNLQDNLVNPKYAELDAESQLVLKYATILHDIGKRFLGDTHPDRGHAMLSTEYATKILERFDLSDEIKARIIKQVKHHHWFEEYNKGHQTPELVAKVIETFGTKEDFTIAEIMAKSDYMNVNEEFHLSRKISRVDGRGLMSEKEFENFMNSSFEKIESQFGQGSEKSNPFDIGLNGQPRQKTRVEIITDKINDAKTREDFVIVKELIDKVEDISEKEQLYRQYLNNIQSVLPEKEKQILQKVLQNDELFNNPTVKIICDKLLENPVFHADSFWIVKSWSSILFRLIDKLNLKELYLRRCEIKFINSEAKKHNLFMKIIEKYIDTPDLYNNKGINDYISLNRNNAWDEEWTKGVLEGFELFIKHKNWRDSFYVQNNIDKLCTSGSKEEKEKLFDFIVSVLSDKEYVPKNNLPRTPKQNLLDKIGKYVNSDPQLKTQDNITDQLYSIYLYVKNDMEIKCLDKIFDTDLPKQVKIYDVCHWAKTRSTRDNINGILDFLDFYKQNPKLFKDCNYHDLNVLLWRIDNKNIELIKTLYKRADINNNDIPMIMDFVTKHNAQLVTELLDDKNISPSMLRNIACATTGYHDTPQDVAIQIQFCKKLQNCEGISVKDWSSLIREAAPVRGQEYRTKLFDKLIANKDFPKNEIERVIANTNKNNIDFVEKLCFDKEFPKDHISTIACNLREDNPELIKFVEKLYANKDFPNAYILNITNGLYFKDYTSILETLVFDKDISMNIWGKLTSYAIGSINENNFKYVQNLLRNYKQLGIPEEQIDKILSCNSEINLNSVIQLNRLLGKSTISQLSDVEFIVCTNNLGMINKKSISSLTKTEKRELLNTILINKSILEDGQLAHLKDIIPLLPQTTEDYVKSIDLIKNSLHMNDAGKLSIEAQRIFNKSLDDFSAWLKGTAHIGDVHLQYSHKEFVAKINYILKDLPQEEQLRIQDLFGFKIVDGKLTGYPNTNISSENFVDKQLFNSIKKEIDSYINNQVIIENNPQLSNVLNSLIKYCPELLNQIDESGDFVKVLQQLQTTLSKKEFKRLSNDDKQIVILAHLLGNTDKYLNTRVDAACEGYFISQKLGLSKEMSQKLYSVIEMLNAPDEFMATSKKVTIRNYRGTTLEGQERQDVFDLIAFKLKEGNLFNLTKMVYESKYPEGYTSRFDKLLYKRIREIKANDFSLLQTASSIYRELAQRTDVLCNNKIYSVNVVNAKDIPNFYALAHTPEAGFASGGTRDANFANFKLFEMIGDDKVICTGYITAKKAGLVRRFHHGFIFEVPNDKQYVGYGTDIFSLGKNIPDMVVEYFRDRGYKANRNRGDKWNHRTFISRSLKRELYGIFGSKLKGVDNKYIARLDNIKAKLGNKPLTLENLQEIDPEFARAYYRVINSKGWSRFYRRLLKEFEQNEVLVSNPKIAAIFTDNVDKIPEEYLIKAQEEDLPIVIINN